MEISGSSAVVTGGASGLGEATVRRLVGAGAKVVILDRDTVKGEGLAKELGDAVAYSPTDVTVAGDVTAAIELAVALGPLRIAVSCAGIGWAGPSECPRSSPQAASPPPSSTSPR